MPIRKYISFTLILILVSCIDRFYVKEENNKEYRPIVISGFLENNTGIAYVEISESSDPLYPGFHPINGCDVYIVGKKTPSIRLDEYEPGKYKKDILSTRFNSLDQYKLVVIVPSRGQYESDYQKFITPNQIKSLHSQREDITTNNFGDTIQGVQFFMDISGEKTAGRYMRAEIEETWEDYSRYPIEAWFDGNYHVERITSFMHCYKTEKVNSIFTLTTLALDKNEFENYKLHYINQFSEKLKNHYTYNVKLHTISKEAFFFWESLRKNNEDNGGLYERQPIDVKGNIKNVKNDEEILGFFEVSSVVEKRIYIVYNYVYKFIQNK